MKIETFHPFEISIYKESANIDRLKVNYAKVYNFYNPSNYREVKFKRDGLVLPRLPIPTDEKAPDIKEFSLPIYQDVNFIIVHLMASFLPPVKWVPAKKFIPKIDNVWLVFRIYKKDTDNITLFNAKKHIEIIGETNNSSIKHIKYEYFNKYKKDKSETEVINKDFKLNLKGSAVNLATVGIASRNNSGSWQIKQFLKSNLPLTLTMETSIYELCNTSRYNIGNLDASLDFPEDAKNGDVVKFGSKSWVYNEGSWDELPDSSTDTAVPQGEGSESVPNLSEDEIMLERQNVIYPMAKFFGEDDTSHYRGYIKRHNINYPYEINNLKVKQGEEDVFSLNLNELTLLNEVCPIIDSVT